MNIIIRNATMTATQNATAVAAYNVVRDVTSYGTWEAINTATFNSS